MRLGFDFTLGMELLDWDNLSEERLPMQIKWIALYVTSNESDLVRTRTFYCAWQHYRGTIKCSRGFGAYILRM